ILCRCLFGFEQSAWTLGCTTPLTRWSFPHTHKTSRLTTRRRVYWFRNACASATSWMASTKNGTMPVRVARRSTRNCRQGPTHSESRPATTTAYGARPGQVLFSPFLLHLPRAPYLKLLPRSLFLGCCGCSTQYDCVRSPHSANPL